MVPTYGSIGVRTCITKFWESKTCKALAVMFTPHTWNLSSCVCVDHHKRCKAYTSLLDWKHDQISHAGHMSIAVASHLQHLQKPHAHDMHPKRFYFRILSLWCVAAVATSGPDEQLHSCVPRRGTQAGLGSETWGRSNEVYMNI